MERLCFSYRPAFSAKGICFGIGPLLHSLSSFPCYGWETCKAGARLGGRDLRDLGYPVGFPLGMSLCPAPTDTGPRPKFGMGVSCFIGILCQLLVTVVASERYSSFRSRCVQDVAGRQKAA